MQGNILILRDKIQILPYDRPTVSYEHLSQLVAEYLLTSCPDVDIDAALSVMPATRSKPPFPSLPPASTELILLACEHTEGMDLNPLFTGATSFRPAGAAGGELQLFAQAGIQLAHGWLVDPAAPEYAVVARMGDYDTAVNLLVEADCLTKGNFVASQTNDPLPAVPSAASGSGSGSGSGETSSGKGKGKERETGFAGVSSAEAARAGPSKSKTYDLTPEEQQKVEDGACSLELQPSLHTSD